MAPSHHTWHVGTVKQWTERGELAPKKAKTVPCTGKVMVSVLWDAHGIIVIVFKKVKQSMVSIMRIYCTV